MKRHTQATPAGKSRSRSSRTRKHRAEAFDKMWASIEKTTRDVCNGGAEFFAAGATWEKQRQGNWDRSKGQVIYVYHNDKGEQREITASMKNPPPERILFRKDSEQWEKAPQRVKNGVWFRVYLPPVVDTAQVRGKYPIVSHTLPHGLNGAPTDKYGRTVILNKAHEDRVLKENGFKRST